MQIARVIFISFLCIYSFQASAQPKRDPSGDCIELLMNKPEFEVLRSKMAIASVQAQTLEMMSSEKKPTKQEKIAINKLSIAVDECFKIGQPLREEIHHPQINKLVGVYQLDFKQALADLYVGKLTYGGFSKAYVEFDQRLASGASDVSAKIKAERDEQSRREAEQRYSRQVQQQMIEENRAQQERAIAAQMEAQRRSAAIGFLLQNQSNQQQMYNNQMQQLQRSYIPPTVTSSCVPNGAGGFNCTSR